MQVWDHTVPSFPKARYISTTDNKLKSPCINASTRALPLLFNAYYMSITMCIVHTGAV